MSLRDYAGHNTECARLGDICPPNCPYYEVRCIEDECPANSCPCTCGLDKAIAEYDARERAIDDLLTECERLVNLVPNRCDTLDDLLRKLEGGR